MTVNLFTITPTPPTALTLAPGHDGKFSFTVTSLAAPDAVHEVLLQALLVVGEDGKGKEVDWLVVGPQRSVRMSGGMTETVTITVRPVASTPRGVQTIKLAIADKDHPNDTFAYSSPVTCEVIGPPVPAPSRSLPRWLLAVIIAGGVVVVIGITLLVVKLTSHDGPPAPVADANTGGSDAAPCVPACTSFTTLHGCRAGEPDTTCSAATPICRTGACVALADARFGTVYSVFNADSVGRFGLVDIDGDGKTDVLAPLNPGNTTMYALGSGDRTFQAPREVPLRKALYFGDLNGDRKADILVQSATSSLDSYAGDGNGNWVIRQPGVTTKAAAFTTGVLADVDGDGHLDFLFASGRAVIIHHGRGDGTFEPETSLTTVSTAAQVLAADCTGDHRLDLIVRENAGSIEVFRNASPRTYAPGVLSSSANATELLFTADFNGDGKSDLLTSTAARDQILVLPNSGDGTFGTAIATPATTTVGGMAIGDFNGDGVPDVAVVQQFDSVDKTILAFIGRGNGTFLVRTTDVRDTQIRAALQTADLLGSGRTDIFYMIGSNGSVLGVPVN